MVGIIFIVSLNNHDCKVTDGVIWIRLEKYSKPLVCPFVDVVHISDLWPVRGTLPNYFLKINVIVMLMGRGFRS